MLEYIFFDAGIRDRFVAWVEARGVAVTVSDERGLLAAVDEDIDDDLAEAIDDHYDRLLQASADALEAAGEGLEIDRAGVQVQLADGRVSMVRLDTELVARLLQCISQEELRDLVQAVTEAVENPDNRPLCQP